MFKLITKKIITILRSHYFFISHLHSATFLLRALKLDERST